MTSPLTTTVVNIITMRKATNIIPIKKSNPLTFKTLFIEIEIKYNNTRKMKNEKYPYTYKESNTTL